MEGLLRQALGGSGDQEVGGADHRGLLAALTVLAGIFLLLSPAIGGEERDITALLARLPDDPLLAAYSHPAWERLIELQESDVRSVTGDTWIRARRDLDLVVKHLERLKTEPFYPGYFRLRQNVRFDPLLRDHDTIVRTRFPWVLFVETLGDPAKSDAAAKETLDILAKVGEDFHLLFGERLQLPGFATLSPPALRVLRVWVFRKRKSFKEYQKNLPDGGRPDVLSMYRFVDRWQIVVHDESEFDREYRYYLAPAATHQLMHLYRKVLLEKRPGEEALWTDYRLRCRSLWFQEGIAEFLVERMKANPYRLAKWKLARKDPLPMWSLEELLSIQTNAEFAAKAARRARGRMDELRRLRYLFFTQSWAWVHFLYHYEAGKYRDKLMAYAKKEFHGVSGPEVFKKVWGAGKDYDWSKVEAEWHAFTDALTEK